MSSSSRDNVTIVTSTATEPQTVGGTAIKMKIETTIRLQEIPASMGNAINVKKEATGMLIFDQIKKNINTMMSTTSSWEPYYVEKFKKRTMKNI